MGYLQVGLIDLPVIVEQDVYVYRPINILTIWAFTIDIFMATEVALNLLCQQKHLAWCLFGLAADCSIEELMVRLKTPRFCLKD